MSLKIDEHNGYSVHLFGQSLSDLLNVRNYPFYDKEQTSLPTLGQVRGNIYLINRITTNNQFGVPLEIPDDTRGHQADPVTGRNYPVYVQNKYN